VSNFADVPVEMHICVPAHAFDYLMIPVGKYEAFDLLSDTTEEVTLQREQCFCVSLNAQGTKVLKILL
jgi:hypothetical protein